MKRQTCSPWNKMDCEILILSHFSWMEYINYLTEFPIRAHKSRLAFVGERCLVRSVLLWKIEPRSLSVGFLSDQCCKAREREKMPERWSYFPGSYENFLIPHINSVLFSAVTSTFSTWLLCSDVVASRWMKQSQLFCCIDSLDQISDCWDANGWFFFSSIFAKANQSIWLALKVSMYDFVQFVVGSERSGIRMKGRWKGCFCSKA